MQAPVIQLLADLVRINSVNPAYQNGPGEAAVADYLERLFHQHQIPTERQSVFPGRDNLLAHLPGRDPQAGPIILEAHMDTVSILGMDIPPFEARIDDGKLYGRGSCDTKAGLAAMVQTLLDLKASAITPPRSLILAAVVDEEHSYRGVVRLCENLTAAAAIVAEPTELQAVIASKGVLRWSIHTYGRAAHSSKPQLGINAIHAMRPILEALENDEAHLARLRHPLVGQATCSVGIIRGGVQVNLVPAQCSIELDRRLLPGEDVAQVLAHYQHLLDQIPGIQSSMDSPMLVDEALDTPADSQIALSASHSLRQLGLPDTCIGVPYGSDASKLSRAGVPSIVFGPGSIDRAHAATEYVEIDQVHSALDFYRHLVLNYPL